MWILRKLITLFPVYSHLCCNDTNITVKYNFILMLTEISRELFCMFHRFPHIFKRTMSTKRTLEANARVVVSSPNAPKAIGPYRYNFPRFITFSIFLYNN
jgi:hypothetical protein